MTDLIGREACIPNPALQVLGFLIGEWRTEGVHPLLPGKALHGRTSFAWVDGGAFLIMRSEIDEPEIPSGIAVFGTDDDTGECSMLYFDERGVSRRYDVELRADRLHYSRHNETFSQRCTITPDQGGSRMVARGEMKRGEAWEPDLQLTYTRISQGQE
ncbi:MAG TPA: hypothetical protein VFL95_12370 [Gemmatimonadales bacterium]|nr:hypothetical protein [Gemmatimonadales bacterium]